MPSWECPLHGHESDDTPFSSQAWRKLCPIQLLKQIVYVGKRVFVLDGLLIDGTVVLDQPASTIFLLHEQTRGTPRRSACTNEPIFLQLRELLLQFNELLRTHLVRMPRDRLCTRLYLNHELNSSHGWNTWQLLWKDIWKLTDNSDLLNQRSHCSVESIQVCWPCYQATSVPNLCSGIMGQQPCLGRTIDLGLVLDKPIHAQNDINVRTRKQDQGRGKRKALNVNLHIRNSDS